MHGQRLPCLRTTHLATINTCDAASPNAYILCTVPGSHRLVQMRHRTGACRQVVTGNRRQSPRRLRRTPKATRRGGGGDGRTIKKHASALFQGRNRKNIQKTTAVQKTTQVLHDYYLDYRTLASEGVPPFVTLNKHHGMHVWYFIPEIPISFSALKNRFTLSGGLALT